MRAGVKVCSEKSGNSILNIHIILYYVYVCMDVHVLHV